MIVNPESSLLPAGFSDMLFPEAENEALVLKRIIAAFNRNGYAQVKLPLLEFEETLFNGTGIAMTEQTFRLMDPMSQKMMGSRADMTPQIARVATTRLSEEPRPLRLCYSGQVLRTLGSQLRPARQFTQVGAEIIGTTSPIADAEVILMALSALAEIGIQNISVDLGLPRLIPELIEACKITKSVSQKLRRALDRKDSGEVLSLVNFQVSNTFLIFCSSPETTLLSLSLIQVITSAIKSTVTFKILPIFLCSLITAELIPIKVISA